MQKINLMPHCTTWSVRVLSAFALMSLVLLLGRSEALAEDCQHVHGRFVNQVDASGDPDCMATGPGGCVRGNVIGVLTGDFLSTNRTAFPADEVEVPGVFFFVSDFVLTTEKGDLDMIETGAAGFPNGDLGDIVTIVGGTEEWAGATGRLRVYGNLIPGVVSDVTYDGDVCIP